MKALKVVALSLLGLLVLVAIALAVVASRFDPAWAKQKLIQAVQEQKQRTLKLDGEVGLSFYPSLGVKLGKASLSERNSQQEFATLDGARISVRLMPLLSRQAVVDRIELDGMRAQVIRNKDGSFNFDDLLAKSKDEKAKDQGGAPSPAGQPIEFDIASIAITNSAISLRDDKAGQAIALSDVNLKTGRLSKGGSGPLEFSFKANAQQPKLNVAFKLGADYRYDVTRRQFALEKLDLKVKGDALDFKDLDAALTAKEAGVGGGQGGIQIEGLVLSAKGLMGDEVLDAKVEMPHLALLDERTSGQKANATLRLAGKQRQLDAKLELAAVEGAASVWKIGKLAAQWSLTQGPLSAKGSIAGPVQTDLKAQVVDLPKLTGELDIAHPQMPMKQLKLPLDGSLRADWGKSQAAASLSSRFDESAVQAKLQVTRFSPLAAGFDLAADRLNFDKYFPVETPAAKPAGNAAPAQGKEGQPTPIDLSFLRGLDLKGAMRVGAFQARNVKLSNFRADVAVRGGRLDVSPISANLYGGTAAGALSAQADGNRIALRQTFSNIAIGQLIRDYARKDLLEGTGQMGLDVTASGNTAAAMTQSLAGSASIKLRDGAIKGINLAKSVRQAKAMIGGKQDAVVGANSAEKTDFSEMSATFNIANGVARNDDLSAKSPYLRVAGAGNIDLPHSRIDYLAKATVVSTSQGQEGKELADLNGLTVPVRLTGPLDNVSYKLEFGAMAADLAKREAQKQVQQQIEKKLDKKGLGEALKGLIK